MANSYTINATQGDSLSLRFTAKDDNGNNLNLSGYSLSGFVKNKYGDSTVLLNLNPTFYSAISGIIDVFVSGNVSTSLGVNRYLYDVEAHGISGTVIKISRGSFFLEPEITS